MNWLTRVSNTEKLFFILGPCALESESHAMFMAEKLVTLAQSFSFNLIFKSSFDKANRTSLQSYRSVGLDQGLRILSKIRSSFAVPVITDVHETVQIRPVADVVDVIQIPAFLCRQTDLLQEAGRSGKPVFVKKGHFLSAENMGSVIQKIQSTGNELIWLGERGYTFGYNNLIVDYRNFPVMKSFGKPVIFDATHSVQQPGGLQTSTGGDRRLVPPLATAAVVQGIAAVFMEVHEDPDKALCDGPNSVRLSLLPSLISYLQDLDAWVKEHPMPEMR